VHTSPHVRLFLTAHRADFSSLKRAVKRVTELFVRHCCRLSFKFLKPPLSEVTNIYTLPFSRSVWVTYTATAAVLAVALYGTARLERWVNPSRTDLPVTFADVVLNSLAIVCSEGKKMQTEQRICGSEHRTLLRTNCLHLDRANPVIETSSV
jgi:hypothetical protein